MTKDQLIEYIMAYGWAILIVIIVAGALIALTMNAPTDVKEKDNPYPDCIGMFYESDCIQCHQNCENFNLKYSNFNDEDECWCFNSETKISQRIW